MLVMEVLLEWLAKLLVASEARGLDVGECGNGGGAIPTPGSLRQMLCRFVSLPVVAAEATGVLADKGKNAQLFRRRRLRMAGDPRCA